jgi:alkylation response protein AidB-like acyl-CoA dehydrogenase
MAIDFTLTPQQRELQLESRRFATEVLAGARAAELLPTAEERFLATRPAYEAMVVAGFLRKCIPQRAGGETPA